MSNSELQVVKAAMVGALAACVMALFTAVGALVLLGAVLAAGVVAVSVIHAKRDKIKQQNVKEALVLRVQAIAQREGNEQQVEIAPE